MAAVEAGDQEALSSVSKQLRAIASGTSGARARELVRLADVIDKVAGGESLDGVPVALGDQPVQPVPEHSATPSEGQKPPVEGFKQTGSAVVTTPLTEVDKPPVS